MNFYNLLHSIKSLKERLSIYRIQHAKNTLFYDNLGAVYGETGNIEKALKFLGKSWDIMKWH